RGDALGNRCRDADPFAAGRARHSDAGVPRALLRTGVRPARPPARLDPQRGAAQPLDAGPRSQPRPDLRRADARPRRLQRRRRARPPIRPLGLGWAPPSRSGGLIPATPGILLAMSDEAWPTPQQPSREPLPRIEDLPVAEQGYEQDSVRAAFDSFYRHAAQLDAALRTLEAVDSFHRQAAALRADLRVMRTGGWTQQT